MRLAACSPSPASSRKRSPRWHWTCDDEGRVAEMVQETKTADQVIAQGADVP
jgi:hypothetical protein